MSKWTYVDALIRVSATGKDFTPKKKDLKLLNIPEGSEGGLNIKISKAKGDTAAAYLIAIYGNLRDYENLEAVVEFMDKVAGKYFIHSGVLGIQINSYTFGYVYDCEFNKFKRV